jgi:hypothetical protein
MSGGGLFYVRRGLFFEGFEEVNVCCDYTSTVAEKPFEENCIITCSCSKQE